MIDPLRVRVIYPGLLPSPTGPLLVLILFLFAGYSTAGSVNRTIDNAGGGLTYAPPASWKEGSTCLACGAQLNPLLTFQGTWEDTTQNIGDTPHSITINFNGTAVYVFNVVVNYLPYDIAMTPVTNLSFVLDHAPAGIYAHIGTGTMPEYQYNILVFSREGLDDTEHVLEVQTEAITSNSLVLFDYVMYTSTESDSSTPSPPLDNQTATSSTPQLTQASPTSIANSGDSAIPVPVGLIVGGTIGGVALPILLIAVLIWWLLRRRRHTRALGSASRDTSEDTEKQIIEPWDDPRTGVAGSRKKQGGLEGAGFAFAPGAIHAHTAASVRASGNTIPDEEMVPADEAFVTPDGASLSGTRMTRRRGDSGTEYTHNTASDGTVTRMKTDIAVLREELTRLRQDRVLQSESWDQGLPHYQERAVE